MQWQSEVVHLNPRSHTFVGSPSIALLASGHLVVSHDYFGSGAPVNAEGEECLTTVYRSADRGQTWEVASHVVGAFWSSLFTHREALYLLGCSAHSGAIVIRRSTDGGWTWTQPRNENTGLLFPSGPGRQPPSYHCAPTPVTTHEGRIYRAFEDHAAPGFARGLQAVVISCPADSDLLLAANWRMSNRLQYTPPIGAQAWACAPNTGWLEGNVVVAPNGELWNLLRFHSLKTPHRAAVVRVRNEGRSITFSPVQFVELPGAMSKFTVRRDPRTGLYLALTNRNEHPLFPAQRDVLAMSVSPDLVNWHHVRTLLRNDLGLSPAESAVTVGFQYADWDFDGDDIVAVVRAAYLGAPNFHDANRCAFLRVALWHELLPHWLRGGEVENSST